MTVYQPLHLCSISNHIPQCDTEQFSSNVACSVISKMADTWYRSIQKQFTSQFWCWLLKREKYHKIWTVVICLWVFFWFVLFSNEKNCKFYWRLKLQIISVRTFYNVNPSALQLNKISYLISVNVLYCLCVLK